MNTIEFINALLNALFPAQQLIHPLSLSIQDLQRLNSDPPKPSELSATLSDLKRRLCNIFFSTCIFQRNTNIPEDLDPSIILELILLTIDKEWNPKVYDQNWQFLFKKKLPRGYKNIWCLNRLFNY